MSFSHSVGRGEFVELEQYNELLLPVKDTSLRMVQQQIFGNLCFLESNSIVKKSQINGKFKREKSEISSKISCLVRVTSWRFPQIFGKKYPPSATVFSVLAYTEPFKMRKVC